MIRFCLLLIMMLPAQTSEKRLLLIFTKAAQNAQYLQQLDILHKDGPGLNERDIQIIQYSYNSNDSRFFQKHKISGDFTIILVGKDGGEKYRSTKPVSLKYLYGLIDPMPMRKAEMKEKGN